MITIFTEIEAIANKRPITYFSDNPVDIQLFTTNHLLLCRYNSGAVIKENDEDISCLRRWKHAVAISNQFWKRRLITYLLSLQSRCKWNVNQINFEPGMIVLLKEENLPSGKWPLARIIVIHPSSDKNELVKVKKITGEHV